MIGAGMLHRTLYWLLVEKTYLLLDKVHIVIYICGRLSKRLATNDDVNVVNVQVFYFWFDVKYENRNMCYGQTHVLVLQLLLPLMYSFYFLLSYLFGWDYTIIQLFFELSANLSLVECLHLQQTFLLVHSVGY